MYRIKRLQRELGELYLLVNDSAKLEHAVYTYDPICDRENWVHFVPTKFIYSVFTFNMLYSINWQKSIEVGRIIEFDSGLRNKEKGVSETLKMSEYIKFCFSDVHFMTFNKEWFKTTVLDGMTADVLINELKRISPDIDRCGYINKNGNVRAESFINDFIESVRQILIDSNFTETIVYKVYNFIYKIRCNMFHGVKTITEMMDPNQQTRLEIYSRFLYVANAMVFRYLDFLQGGVEGEDF